MAVTLVLPTGVAHAEPSVTEARKKLEKLNKQVDQLVEKYNQVNEDLKAAKKKYLATQKTAKRELATYEQLRTQIAQMAASAYKNGDMGEVTQFVSAGNPQTVLDQVAVFTHLSENRSSQISQFLSAAQRVQRQQAQAKGAYDEVLAKANELKTQKTKVEKSIKTQEALIRRLGGTTPSRSGPVGATYNGPASGSARTALNFAYAQIGKPYQYGAEGPGSYDCSGLTMKAWAAAGVSITRTTHSQHAATRRVSYENLQPGDLVFFSGLGHVGMYAGNGQMVHAPSSGKNVQVVNITSGYYRQNFHSAGRP
ncbi:hypothetical protein DPM19_21785 [Actinomadura craniellae]|uniref:NlpC/P60 domain-containing protein n=1 Tax=Actinomadura craniellae TaxID=2231787 RepID=A0A365H2K6_9ACTN|nr:hypothetical protein DPM19_21785 [Actinomadura craniellae]